MTDAAKMITEMTIKLLEARIKHVGSADESDAEHYVKTVKTVVKGAQKP